MLNRPSSLEAIGTHSSDIQHERDRLRLDPGLPERKPRSAFKRCFLTTLTIIVLLVCGLTCLAFQRIWRGIHHPHRQLYYDKPATEVTDWSEVVRPMITESDSFDIIASVWVRDEEGKDGRFYFGGAEHPEKLIYSDAVFRNLNLGGKLQHANVSLRVPTSRQKRRVDATEFDLRASFVLVQRYQPQRLDGAKRLYTWEPESLRSPNMRYWAETPSFQDQIYDSFGFTIPLLQLHNVTQITPTEMMEDLQIEAEDPAFYARPNDDSDLIIENNDDTQVIQEDKGQTKNTFVLELTGDVPKLVTDIHPYIVTRTHLTIFEGAHLYNRNAYVLAQKELANKTCINPKTKAPYENPRWYQCLTANVAHGVLQTMVQVESNQEESKNSRQKKQEYLYAPYLGSLIRGHGPKVQFQTIRLPQIFTNLTFAQDLIPVPDNRENTSSSDEDFVNVTWQLTFSGHSPTKHLLLGLVLPIVPPKYNLTAPENELLLRQRELEALIGLFGYRNHQDAHPRRVHALDILVSATFIVTFVLAIHYWYTCTSTMGISRFGTTLIASSALLEVIGEFLTTIVDSGTKGERSIMIVYMLACMDVFVMLKAIMRLEFGFQEKRIGKTSWFKRIYIAKATHAERASARIEARVSMRLKLQFLLVLFAIIYYFKLAYWYPVLPTLLDPAGARHNAFLSFHAYAPVLLKAFRALRLTGEIGGQILQLVMNTQLRTYAGKYKTTAALLFIGNLARVLDMLPIVVGISTRTNGFGFIEGSRLVLSFMNVVQAVKYRSVKASDVDETEK